MISNFCTNFEQISLLEMSSYDLESVGSLRDKGFGTILDTNMGGDKILHIL